MINTVQWFIVNPVKTRIGDKKEREDKDAKKKYFGDFCRTNYRAVYSLRNELFTFFNLKYHSVYYAQHIPHRGDRAGHHYAYGE